jgi:3-phenylpropionate/trans-cinnamate dioxygenase alpha subunit
VLEKEKGEKAANLLPGAWDASLFPNCSYLYGANVFKVWHPLGPNKVEIMTWAIAEKNMSEDLKLRIKTAAHRTFGTAGILEGDDLDSFEYGNRPNKGYMTRQGRLNLQMGLGREREDADFPGIVGEYMNELAQRGYYRAYADFMSSSNWQELEANSADWKEDHLRNNDK